MMRNILLAASVAVSPLLGGCSGGGGGADAFWCAMFFGVGGDQGVGFIGGTGGRLWHTTDGGMTATMIDTGVPYDINDIRFTGPTTGFIVGDDGGVGRSTDAGATWNFTMLPVNASLQQLEWAGPGSQRGWIFGHDGVIARTDDDGVTWTLQNTGTNFDFYGGCFDGPDLGWAVGQGGMIMGTIDGGDQWTAWPSGVVETLRGCFRDGDFGLVVGDNGTVLDTQDGGNTWNPIPFGFANNLYDVGFKPDLAGRVVVGGVGGLWLSENFGNTWGLALSAAGVFKRVQYFADGHVYAITNRMELYESQDDGVNWFRVQIQLQF